MLSGRRPAVTAPPAADAIDLVYLWCDATDEAWRRKKEAVARKYGLADGNFANASYRFVSNDDLRYSLRSLDMFAPWIRRVFVLMDDDNRPPPWLDASNGRLALVRLGDFMPSELLPCFCSPTIEHYLPRVPGLSNRFIYANDDMMFGRNVQPSFFFSEDGFPICRFAGRAHRLDWEPKNDYHSQIKRAAEVVLAANPKPRRDLMNALVRLPHHNMDAYRRDDLADAFAKYEAEITATMDYPFRSPGNVQRVLYLYEALARGRGHYRLARTGTGSGRLQWFKNLLRRPYADSLQFVRAKWRLGPSMLARWNPGLFCFNDTKGITDDDRRWLRGVYESMFPRKSSFEK